MFNVIFYEQRDCACVINSLDPPLVNVIMTEIKDKTIKPLIA